MIGSNINDALVISGGMLVPAVVLQHSTLNPAMLHTWMLLRILVGRADESGLDSIREWEAYTGKSAPRTA